MRGFQPQKFADGGLVQGLKRAFGMDEERNARVAAYRAQAAQEAAQNQQQAAPAPAPAPAVSDYMGMGAMKRREKAAGLKDGGTVKPRGFKAGGLIRGPGTGTSDSIETEKRPGTFIMPADSTQAIGPEALEELGEVDDSAMEEQGEAVPVRLSNGEFELPPEQVQALGESVLTVMRDATHRPVRGFAPEAQPEEPRQFFASGGVVQDEEKQRLANQTAMYVRGAQESAANRPSTPPSAPQPVSAQTAPAPAPAAAGFMPGARAVFNESGKAIGDLAKQGRYAAAAGETARAALAYVPAVADDVLGGAFRAVAPTVADAGKQFFGAGDSATAQAPAVGPMAKAASTTASSTPQVPAQPSSVAMAPAVEPTAAPAGQPLAAGNVSAQNNAAAEALSAPRAAGFVPGGGGTALPAQVAAPVVRNSTNDWAARKALENAATAASSITNDPSRIGARAAALSPDNVAYQAALKNDQALQLAQPGMDLAAMRENAALQREGMQQSGADQRSARGFQIDNRRAGIEEKRAATEAEARGFDIRQGYRQEKLSERYDAAKTPEEKAAVAQQIRDLSGKQTESPWKVQVTPTTKNADGSTTEGSVIRYNLQTGQAERVDLGQGGAQQPLDKNLQAIAVRDNPNLSREQKVEALRKLGYQG